MRTITQVQFDDRLNERSVFERMAVGLDAAFPNTEWEYKSVGKQRPANDDARAQRLLGRLATRGETFAAEHLQEAWDCLDIMIERLEDQVRPEYWQSEIKVVERLDIDTTRVPLIVDPEGVVKMLTEARQQFLDAAIDARNLVTAALPLATPLRESEEDEWVRVTDRENLA